MKHISTFENFLNEKKEEQQEAVYMAPKNRASLKKYDGQIAKILSDEGSTATIEFEDGKKLTVVPKEQLRFVE